MQRCYWALISRKTFLWPCGYIPKNNPLLGFLRASDTHMHLEDLVLRTHSPLCPALCGNLGQVLGTRRVRKSELVNS